MPLKRRLAKSTHDQTAATRSQTKRLASSYEWYSDTLDLNANEPLLSSKQVTVHAPVEIGCRFTSVYTNQEQPPRPITKRDWDPNWLIPATEIRKENRPREDMQHRSNESLRKPSTIEEEHSLRLKTAANDVIIAVMGVTGAGKSSFISLLTGRKDIAIGKGLRSETQKVTSYKFKHQGINYVLVDTPGFNDTRRTDTEILEEIVTWLATTYSDSVLLSGIIYLHPISDPRVQGSTMTQIQVFKQLCGKDFYSNVVLATTFWETTDLAVAERREAELFTTDRFLGDMKDGGSQTTRITKSRTDGLKIIESIGTQQRGAMKVQKELSKTGGTFKGTMAAKALSSELVKLSKRFEKQMKVAKRLPLNKKLIIKWNQYKYEKAAKALAKTNAEKEEITYRENESKRDRVRRQAEERKKLQDIRESKIKAEAETLRAERAAEEARDRERMRELRAKEEKLRKEEAQERKKAEDARKKREADLKSWESSKITQKQARVKKDKKIIQASREKCSKFTGSFVSLHLLLIHSSGMSADLTASSFGGVFVDSLGVTNLFSQRTIIIARLVRYRSAYRVGA